MNTNNLMCRTVKPANYVTIQDLPIGLVELLEEDLKQISGGRNDIIFPNLTSSFQDITIIGGTTTFNNDGTFTNEGGIVKVIKVIKG